MPAQRNETTDAPVKVVVLPSMRGDASAFAAHLTALGIDPHSPVVPPGVVVIHPGDLIGPRNGASDPNGCVALARALYESSPSRFYTLWSQNEHAALSSDDVGLTPSSRSWLNRQWRTATIPAALALDAPRGFIVVTHDGVDIALWKELGSPDYQDCAEAINSTVGSDAFALLTRPDSADLGPQTASFTSTHSIAQNLAPAIPSMPGVPPGIDCTTWSGVPVADMIDSWIDLADRRPLPFMQIYAKADEVVDWDTATAQPALSERATGTLVIDADKRQSYTIVDIGARLIGLSAQADRSSPLVFADTRVSTGIQDPARPKRWRYTGPR